MSVNLPAAPGWRAYVEIEGNDATTPHDELFMVVPIVAWRIDADGAADPVLPRLPGERGRVFIQLDDGWIIGPHACFYDFDDLAAAVADEHATNPERFQNG